LLELLDLPVSGTHVPSVSLSGLKYRIDLLQLFVFIPLGLGLVLLVPLFLLSVVSVHHFLIGRLVLDVVVAVEVVVAVSLLLIGQRP